MSWPSSGRIFVGSSANRQLVDSSTRRRSNCVWRPVPGTQLILSRKQRDCGAYVVKLGELKGCHSLDCRFHHFDCHTRALESL